ncbi:hypothetical protein DPV79_40160 [Burkholderia reimsis]|uniref:CopG family transcriptional regulator n=1 Tax=Burkholderia reimsis TaxID=2234132 RepID=A0A365QH14_9BURK|nr:hypothetical protein [Burkholderia reimsis]RBB31876.1 hypothetical protein DPV79_40160 [Burkholderia reimsis]
MGLTKAPKKPPTDATAQFINRAPDAPTRSEQQSPAEVSQNKKPITITFDPVLLAQLDAAAKRIGISRSSALAVAVSKWLGIE